MEKENIKKGKKYLVIGILVLFLAILGSSVAYYLARVQGSLSGNAAGTELAINVEKVSSKATGDLIPLDNDLETLNLAAAGYQDKGACVDINGYSVCQIYHITLTNNGSVPLTVNGTVTLSGQNVPNIDCVTMNSATEVANNNSCMSGMFVSGDTLAANDSNDYYVMVYINNLDEPQTDSGAFNGTVTFTTEDGKKVKGRFTKPFNLVKHIEELYDLNGGTIENKTAKTIVTNNEIQYNYATNVGLMNDRLGGTTTSLDGGNTRYYGSEPNNWIDIGDKTEVEVTEGNWVSLLGNNVTTTEQCKSTFGITDDSTTEEIDQIDTIISSRTKYKTLDEFCSTSTTPAGTPILWRIIGIFDGKLRIRRDENIGNYSWDISASDVNNGRGINEWSQADLMKLLNPGFEANKELDSDGTAEITVNNSLYWNSGSGNCYGITGDKHSDLSLLSCDFTNKGLSEEAKEYVVDQTLYLGGFESSDVYADQAYVKERGNNVIQNPSDGIPRTTSWTGKVGLIYFSDFLYATDFSNENCQGNYEKINGCGVDWILNGYSWTISPFINDEKSEVFVTDGSMSIGTSVASDYGGWPTLLLDSSVLAESGNGSKSNPYVVAY